MKKALFIFISLFLLASQLWPQETQQSADTTRKDALNVYMDATDYIKKQIPYINYVRDRKVADLNIISTYEQTGSGGSVTTFFLEGQGKYQGMSDTLKCVTNPDETYDIRRAKEVKTLKLGLTRYVAKTPLAQFMDVNFNKPLSETVSTDKWNNWVFRASLNAYTSGQSTYSYGYLYGTISANRITEKSKFRSSLGVDFETDKSKYQDTTYTTNQVMKYGSMTYVKSLSDHWSAGVMSEIQSDSYSNYKLAIDVSPGIEYDIFPYTVSTRRILTIQYKTGMEFNNYEEQTVRFKTNENVGFHSLSTYFSIIQKWGSISSQVSWRNYFFDWSYYRLRFYTSTNLRLFKGLSLNLYGSVAAVHDQISLPAGNATLEDVLLRRKMQKTEYNYYTSVGFSYTFGSIYNNAVNPRFDY